MNKKEVSKRVLKYGKPLPIDKFTWDEDTNTFSSIEDNLVLDFNEINSCTFNVGAYCTFNTGDDCTFNTGEDCTFKTWSNCTFNTGPYCTFKTGARGIFKTGNDCTFKTGDYCTFNTLSDCTFDTWSDCTFKTGEGCVVVRRDVYEVIELKKGEKIKLNGYEVKGFTVINDSKRCEKCNHLIEDGINE